MIFVDTGAFLARWVARDQHHEAAERAWAALASDQRRLCTSNFVLDETLTLLSRRVSHGFAVERGAALWSSEALTILRPGRDDELAALELFRKLADQRVSYTDCVSFALMRRERLRQVFTFDRHFLAAGFRTLP